MEEGLLYYMGSLLPCPTERGCSETGEARSSGPALGYCEQMYLRSKQKGWSEI